ncbi:MAG TPA: hypothetical protein VLX91_14085 [Candidatus Acidoferrales bacterium]|nr:hypothetical protein [Candidatus Acidoferrales bacterium]
MSNVKFALIFLICFAATYQIFSPENSCAQETYNSVVVKNLSPDTLVQLPQKFILRNSELVVCDSVTLMRNTDYVINYTAGTIRFQRSGSFFSHKQDSTYSIKITYRNFPFTLPLEYEHNVEIVKYDTAAKKSVTLIEQNAPLTTSEFFGNNMQKSGSIVRGFTIGSNQDLTLNSGFRMQLAGNLTNDVNVTAALTDESSPIQPEGNTKTLQEFDKVFVTIKSPHIAGTLGDFEMSEQGTEFGVVNRKLQGAMGNANYGETSVMLSGAVSRGKFRTQEIAPIDGSEGPYQLVGTDGSADIIVIAGTERVYLDGAQMVRGETNDYVIDYSNAQVTFTAKHLITNLSRIFVDFEYSDGQFQRTFFGGNAQTSVVDDKIDVGVSYYQESDDPNSAFGVSLSDSDKALLGNAGKNRLAASKGGAVYVGRDSISGIGKGQYRLDSILVSGKSYYIYRFVLPTDTANLVNAVYIVAFSEVGQGNGDYQSVGFGQFNFVGVNQGDYAPIVVLPMPQSQQLADVDTRYHFDKEGSFSLEYAASSFDANRLSSLPGVTTDGYGMKFGLDYAPKHLRLGDSDIGALNFNEMTRYENMNFNPMDRTNDVEFNREWGIDTLTAGNELLNQAHIDFTPSMKKTQFTIGGDIGRIARGSDFSSGRYAGFITLGSDSSWIPSIDYHATLVDSKDNAFSNSGTWFTQAGLAQIRFGKFTPGFRIASEDRRLETTGTDSLWTNSYRYVEYGPNLSISQIFGIDLSTDMYVRNESGIIGGEMLPSSSSLTNDLTMKLNAPNNFSSNLTLTYRRKTYTEGFRNLGNSDNESFLSKWESNYAPLDRGVETNLFYQVTTERAARLQQIFWKVLPGQGQYIWIDSKHNGQVDITDPTEFQQVNFNGDYTLLTRPTTTLYPVVNLQTNVRLGLTPEKFIKDDGSLTSTVLRALSSVTLWQVAENNQTTNVSDIYLLHLSKFLNDSLTINGSQLFQQDFYVLQNNRDFSLRLRFLQNKSLNQYSFSTERGYKREQSMRLRTKLTETFYEELDLSLSDDDVATTYTERAHTIRSSGVGSELSYKPDANVESSFRVQFSKGVDAFRSDLTNSMNTEILKVAYSILSRGRLTSQLERDEVVIENQQPNVYLPFELTQGFLPGQTYIVQLGFDYRINSFIQATANYSGRSQAGGAPIHTMTAEVRAFF